MIKKPRITPAIALLAPILLGLAGCDYQTAPAGPDSSVGTVRQSPNQAPQS